MDEISLELNNCIEIAKTMKCDFAYFDNMCNCIGADYGLYVLKELVSSNISEYRPNTFLDIGDIKNSGIYNLENPVVVNKLIQLNNILKNYILNSNLIYDIPDCRDEQFEASIQKKTKEGITLYKLDNSIIITLYKGLLPVNKSDKVSLQIYDNGSNMFVSKFTIRKPKNVVINIYMGCLKLG